MTDALAEERRGTAYHEAGHAVAALHAGPLLAFREVTIAPVPVPGMKGMTWPGGVILPPPPPGPQDPLIAKEERQVAMYQMAGPEAELVGTGHETGRRAHKCTIREKLHTGSSRDESDAYVQRAEDEAREFVAGHWAEIKAVADALLEHERLEYEQVARLAAAARGST